MPQLSDRWMCSPPCGCVWTTFEACGVRTQCGRNWEDTQCLACHRWLRHAESYHEFVPGEEEAETHSLVA